MTTTTPHMTITPIKQNTCDHCKCDDIFSATKKVKKCNKTNTECNDRDVLMSLNEQIEKLDENQKIQKLIDLNKAIEKKKDKIDKNNKDIYIFYILASIYLFSFGLFRWFYFSNKIKYFKLRYNCNNNFIPPNTVVSFSLFGVGVASVVLGGTYLSNIKLLENDIENCKDTKKLLIQKIKKEQLTNDLMKDIEIPKDTKTISTIVIVILSLVAAAFCIGGGCLLFRYMFRDDMHSENRKSKYCRKTDNKNSN